MMQKIRFFNIFKTKLLFLLSITLCLTILLSETLPSCLAETGVQAPKDKLNVVLLLDSSASMLVNDPDKLRTEGARLLLQFLKPGDNLSLVAFDEQARIIRPSSAFAADQIPTVMALLNSQEANGQYTDLNAGLLKAIEVLKSSAADDLKPVVVLLSDGKMDPAPARGSADSHMDSLTTTILPILKTNGFSVYTLSFSQDADKALLQHIAQATDGINWFTPNSETIHESFADLFLSLKKPQVVASGEKGFKIETNIEEATFYVNQPEDVQLKLETPDEEVFTAKDLPENIRWFEGKKFSVITISNPIAGDWKLIGVNPDEGFATILTNLKLVTDWPNAIPVDEKVTLRARLYEGSLPVDLKAISDAVTFAFQVTPSDRVSEPIIRELLNDQAENGDETAKDGVFSSEFKLSQAGEYRLRVIVKGPTFERQLQIPFRVRPPLVHLSISDPLGAAKDQDTHNSADSHEHAAAKEDHDDHKHEDQLAPAKQPKNAVFDGSNLADFQIDLNDEVATYKNVTIKVIAIDKKRNKYSLDAKPVGEESGHVTEPAKTDSHDSKHEDKHATKKTKSHDENESTSLNYVASASALPADGLYELKAYLKARTRDGKDVDEESEPLKFNRKTIAEVVAKHVEVKAETKVVPVETVTQSVVDIISLVIVTVVNLLLGAGLFYLLKKSQGSAASSSDFQLPEGSAELKSRLEELEKLAAQDSVDINDSRFKEPLDKPSDTGSFNTSSINDSSANQNPEEGA